jgi:hypothetical protein
VVEEELSTMSSSSPLASATSLPALLDDLLLFVPDVALMGGALLLVLGVCYASSCNVGNGEKIMSMSYEKPLWALRGGVQESSAVYVWSTVGIQYLRNSKCRNRVRR